MQKPILAVARSGLPLIAAVLTSLAWWMPNTGLGALLGWLAALSLVGLAHTAQRPYRASYLCGVITNALGFGWLYYTIRHFGGFPPILATLTFALFVLLSALQYPLWILFFRSLPKWLTTSGMGVALSWCSAELLSIRIFPWHLGHTQLGWLTFAQIADLGGALLISLVMLSFTENLFLLVKGERRLALVAGPLLFAATIGYGLNQLQRFSQDDSPSHKVGIIQANISTVTKNDMKFFEQNTARYIELSHSLAEQQVPLLIWPESVLIDWIDEDARHRKETKNLPHLPGNTALLSGALTYNHAGGRFNSAIALLPNGSLLPPYHKRILMPFGEYMPFASTFPALAELNPAGGDFTAGESSKVFKFPATLFDSNTALKIAPLICYEDVLPRLSREAVKKGAELLVNLTNDAWFGDTPAPFQHHQIAAFRAIETRRFLIRSTNSGLTAVVDPAGRTLARLPTFAEGVLVTGVTPLSHTSPYILIGDTPFWIIGLALLIGLCLKLARRLR